MFQSTNKKLDSTLQNEIISSSRKELNLLNENILALIFSNIYWSEFQYLKFVCKRFHKIIRENKLCWNDGFATFYHVDIAKVFQPFFERIEIAIPATVTEFNQSCGAFETRIKSLILSLESPLGETQMILFKSLCNFKKLQHLVIKFPVASSIECINEFSNFLKNAKSLEILDISFDLLNQKMAHSVASAIENTISPIKKLKLRFEITYKSSTAAISNALSSMKKLKKLKILMKLQNIHTMFHALEVYDFFEHMKNLKQLESLKFIVFGGEFFVNYPIFQEFKNLKSLVLGNSIDPRNLLLLCENLKTLKHLKKLKIVSNVHDEFSAYAITKVISNVNKLTTLNFECGSIGPLGMRLICNQIGNLKMLKHLSFRENIIPSQILEEQEQFMELFGGGNNDDTNEHVAYRTRLETQTFSMSSASLTRLCFSRCRIDDEWLKNISLCLPNIPNLKTLDISQNTFSHTGFNLLANNFKNLSQLEEFDISYNFIDNGFQQGQFTLLSKLELLNVSGCGLTNCLSYLLKDLVKMKALLRLYMVGNFFDLVNAPLVANLLENANGIRVLTLGTCSISERELLNFASKLKHLRNLSMLTIETDFEIEPWCIGEFKNGLTGLRYLNKVEIV